MMIRPSPDEMSRTIDGLQRDIQYLEEKRRKLHSYVEQRQKEALKQDEENRKAAQRAKEEQQRIAREIAVADERRRLMAVELDRLNAELSVTKERAAQELKSPKPKMKEIDAGRKPIEPDPSTSENLRMLQRELESRRTAIQGLDAEIAQKYVTISELNSKIQKQKQTFQAQPNPSRNTADPELVAKHEELMQKAWAWDTERQEMQTTIQQLEADIQHLNSELTAMQQREEAMAEQRNQALEECRGLVTIAEDLSVQLEDAKKTAEAQALLAREWQELSGQATASQKQEIELRTEATQTVEDLKAIVSQQEVMIEELQNALAALKLEAARTPSPPPPPFTATRDASGNFIIDPAADHQLVPTNELRAMEADLRVIKGTLDDSLAIQDRLQSLLDQERTVREAVETQLKVTKQLLEEQSEARRAFQEQIAGGDEARRMMEVELHGKLAELESHLRTRESNTADVTQEIAILHIRLQESDVKRIEFEKRALRAEQELDQYMTDSVEWRTKYMEMQTKLLDIQGSQDYQAQFLEQRLAEAESRAADRDTIWEQLQTAVNHLHTMEQQLELVERDRQALQDTISMERLQWQLESGPSARENDELHAKVLDLQEQLWKSKQVRMDLEELLKKEEELRIRMQTEISHLHTSRSPLGGLSPGRRTVEHLDWDREKLMQEIATLQLRVHALEEQLEHSEGVRRLMERELARKTEIRKVSL